MGKLKIDLGFATLVAERGTDENYHEIFIGIEDKDGVWIQDLAIVGQKYHYTDDGEVVQDKGINVMVYMDRLSETYNMWESWWVEGDEDEDGNEIPSNKINNPGYISYKRALELLNHTINYCADNGNVELEIVRRDLDAIGFTNNELKWLGHDWILEGE